MLIMNNLPTILDYGSAPDGNKLHAPGTPNHQVFVPFIRLMPGTNEVDPEAWAAWAYLIVFSSMFAFTSFIKALRLLPTNIVMTYAYVNPVVAVFLGWTILGEPVTRWTIGGSALIFLGVMGVFHERRAGAKPTRRSEQTAG